MSQIWWHHPVILLPRRLGQEGRKFTLRERRMETCWVGWEGDYKDEGMLEASYIATMLLVGQELEVTPM